MGMKFRGTPYFHLAPIFLFERKCFTHPKYGAAVRGRRGFCAILRIRWPRGGRQVSVDTTHVVRDAQWWGRWGVQIRSFCPQLFKYQGFNGKKK